MPETAPRFIVDSNVGRLAKWLRVIGYDSVFINDIDDDALVRIALRERRVVLTKDTQIVRRRVVTSGRLRVILINHDHFKDQLRQVVKTMNLDCRLRQFSLCIECNRPLVPKSKEDVEGQVPPYVFRTQTEYMVCAGCGKIYWQGTHWQRMTAEVEGLFRVGE